MPLLACSCSTGDLSRSCSTAPIRCQTPWLFKDGGRRERSEWWCALEGILRRLPWSARAPELFWERQVFTATWVWKWLDVRQGLWEGALEGAVRRPICDVVCPLSTRLDHACVRWLAVDECIHSSNPCSRTFDSVGAVSEQRIHGGQVCHAVWFTSMPWSLWLKYNLEPFEGQVIFHSSCRSDVPQW